MHTRFGNSERSRLVSSTEMTGVTDMIVSMPAGAGGTALYYVELVQPAAWFPVMQSFAGFKQV
jgi:hypothetical protein